MVRSLLGLAGLVALGLAAVAAAAPADAAPRRGNVITLQARSYFDAGVVVKPGTGRYNNYALAGQSMQTPAWGNSSLFGGETLPSRLYVPNCCGVAVNTPNFYTR